MKQWKCTVCGYIHNGESPPEICPVCGADSTKFVEIKETQPVAGSGTKKAPSPGAGDLSTARRFFNIASDQMTKRHAHPISVHIPNGVLPVGVLFLMMALFFQLPSLELASFYNLIVVVLSMPLVIFFGYIDWKNRFGGNMTSLFMAKMVCGGVVTMAGMLLVIWRVIDPEVAGPESAHRLAYVLVHILMLAAAVFAGYLGGKLVFKK
jgi:rubredoxin/uncharacterized membrane protein